MHIHIEYFVSSTKLEVPVHNMLHLFSEEDQAMARGIMHKQVVRYCSTSELAPSWKKKKKQVDRYEGTAWSAERGKRLECRIPNRLRVSVRIRVRVKHILHSGHLSHLAFWRSALWPLPSADRMPVFYFTLGIVMGSSSSSRFQKR